MRSVRRIFAIDHDVLVHAGDDHRVVVEQEPVLVASVALFISAAKSRGRLRAAWLREISHCMRDALMAFAGAR
jgi:hypothetical protein